MNPSAVPQLASLGYLTGFVLSLLLRHAAVKATFFTCGLSMLHTLRDAGVSELALLCCTLLDGVFSSSRNSEATSPSLSSFKPFVYQSNPCVRWWKCCCNLAHT